MTTLTQWQKVILISQLCSLRLITHVEYSDHHEESEEVPEEECDSDSDVEIHDPRVEYLFELASKRWDFHPFVVDFLREVSNYIESNDFDSLNEPQFNQRDPIPEGPQGIQLLDDLAVAYDVVCTSSFFQVGGF